MNKDVFTEKEVDQLAYELAKYSFDEGNNYNIYPSADEDDDNIPAIGALLEWQDKKHGHEAFKELVNKFFDEKGINVTIKEEVVMPEDENGLSSVLYWIEKSGEPVEEGMENLEESAKNPVNVQKVLDDLNKPIHIDADEDGDWEAEDMDSPFKFKMEKKQMDDDGKFWFIWDENEEFNIDFEETTDALAYDAAQEFGIEYKKYSNSENDILTRIEKAVKKDFGKDAYIDWYDNVSMYVAK